MRLKIQRLLPVILDSIRQGEGRVRCDSNDGILLVETMMSIAHHQEFTCAHFIRSGSAAQCDNHERLHGALGYCPPLHLPREIA